MSATEIDIYSISYYYTFYYYLRYLRYGWCLAAGQGQPTTLSASSSVQAHTFPTAIINCS